MAEAAEVGMTECVHLCFLTSLLPRNSFLTHFLPTPNCQSEPWLKRPFSFLVFVTQGYLKDVQGSEQGSPGLHCRKPVRSWPLGLRVPSPHLVASCTPFVPTILKKFKQY